MKKVLVINQGHTKNYGDIAINNTITEFFRKKGLEVDFLPFWEETIIFGKNYKDIPYIIIRNIMKRTYLVDFLNKLAIKKQLKNKKYDAVIIGGGELIGNHDGFNSSLYVLTKMFKKKRVPVYLLAVSGDTDISNKLKERYKESLKRCKQIIVRDGHTEKICKEVYKTNCIKGADVVFSYLKIVDKENNEDIKKNKKDIVIIVPISFNKKVKEVLKLNSKDEYYDYILKMLNKNLDKNDKIIITSSVLDDEKTSEELYNYIKNKNIENEIEYIKYSSLEDFINLLKKSKKIISARMHAMILGLIYDNKIEVIPFKKKLQVFKEEYQDVNNVKVAQNYSLKELEEIYNEICNIEN